MSSCRSTWGQIYFFAFKLKPTLIVKVLVELSEILGAEEVNKPVSDVAVVLSERRGTCI